LNFGDIYGMGAAAFAARAHLTVKQATAIKKAKRAAMPDYARLLDEIEQRGRAGYPITTWGGREYFAEERQWSTDQNRWLEFYYKLLNYLIQGSAGDCAKEALIRYDAHPKREAEFLTSVHDETNAGAPRGRVKEEMAIMREIMEGIEFRVFMRSGGKTGPNWGTLTAYKECVVDNVPLESRVVQSSAATAFHEAIDGIKQILDSHQQRKSAWF
jgi:DNA polymerase I-like protein with 3'-5' exonuclease and polymerase domains